MPYLYAVPGEFRVGNVAHETDRSYHRVTVDYPEDLEVVRSVFDELYRIRPDFSAEAIIDLLDRRPDLVDLNAMHNVLLRNRMKALSVQ